MDLKDEALPLDATITGFSPFIPGDADASSFPAGCLEYTFRNTGKKPQKAVFSLNSRNFMGNGPIGSFPGVATPAPEAPRRGRRRSR